MGWVEVHIYGNRGNPLSNPQAVTPHIVYDYSIVLSDHAIMIEGKHSAYPWHELLIQAFEPAGVTTYFIEQYDPTSTFLSQLGYHADPGYLFFSNIPVPHVIYF